jgi:hypothetical protein
VKNWWVFFLLGALVASSFFVWKSSDSPEPPVVTETDTVYVKQTELKIDTLHVVKKRPVYIVRNDTVVVHDTVEVAVPYFVSTGKFNKEELTAEVTAWAECTVDSMALKYNIKPEYINSLVLPAYKDGYQAGLQSYPSWKKYTLFGAGAVSTGVLFFLVK